MKTIELRSDTFTLPTPEMREAMASADVGDDVYGEDPTINRLEALAAEHMGMEAALFTSSGTQSNLLAILTHCGRGAEVILGHNSHVFRSTVGGAAALGGVHTYPVPIQPGGTLNPDHIQSAVRNTHNVHHPLSQLVVLENTNGAANGMPLTAEYTQSIRDLCDQHNMKLHIDGARIWNAAAALNCTVSDLVSPAHSVGFCISKGLGAPVGSLLCGESAFINQARRFRKMLGGGMRQAGILAAAGIIAIEKIAPRLSDDHITARQLAEGLAQIDGIEIDLEHTTTNMVFFSLSESIPLTPAEFARQLRDDHKVNIGGRGGRNFRAITHLWITTDDITRALSAVRTVMESAS